MVQEICGFLYGEYLDFGLYHVIWYMVLLQRFKHGKVIFAHVVMAIKYNRTEQ